jgi:hypothetical protein
MAKRARAVLGPGGRLVPLALLAVALAVLTALPAASLGATPRSSTSAPAASSNGISASVTWNGANILDYSSATAAARIDFNGVADVRYNWSLLSPTSGPGPTITDARLQIFYFGFALATRDILEPSGASVFVMNWSTGSLQYILEGSYRLVASLLAQNGTTVWSQSFWAYVAAPFYIGALLPIVLILIVLWEVYSLATVGKQAAIGRRPPTPPEPEGPKETSVTPPETGTSAPTEPVDSTPPPEGGGT